MEALALAGERGIHHLPVVDADALVGVVCTCDLRAAKPDSVVTEVMKKPALTLDAEREALEAAALMAERGVGSIVVVRDDRPLGIVTRGDLLERVPESQAVMGASECECCGLTRHLRTNEYGQTLCIYCYDRGHDGDWYDTGGEG
jgi:acetoin utilization protein AcuB